MSDHTIRVPLKEQHSRPQLSITLKDNWGEPQIMPLGMPTPIRSVADARAWADALSDAADWLEARDAV
jgi:hypothetical protein